VKLFVFFFGMGLLKGKRKGAIGNSSALFPLPSASLPLLITREMCPNIICGGLLSKRGKVPMNFDDKLSRSARNEEKHS
jgi:hypothetical protein